MTKINYLSLREAAERATQGKWWIDSHGQAMVAFPDDGGVLEIFAVASNRPLVRHEDTGNLSRWRNDNDATYIAAAGPATMLALLDELEAKKFSINKQREYYEGVIADGGKRIAELQEIKNAAEKLVRCKGRYHSEQNYRALAALFGVKAPELPPLEKDDV
ncbi:ead/Ea22-like family protein [Escherichia coli]|nr:ead/Ea22-like family protein [Escherichia coli]MBB9841058.1 ead/Ea22-like family protein [Escherichia coli]MBS9328484.1 ead/Ea22-like family protein [Escherichia coli]